MSRRRFAPVNRHIDGNRTSIGDSYVNGACADLDRAALIEIKLMLPRTFDVTNVTPMLFSDEIVHKLREAAPYVDSSSAVGTYEWDEGHNSHVSINFKAVDFPTPTEDAYSPYTDRKVPLVECINIATQIREKYAAVKHMLRWFNNHATPAAIRALWPCVLTLCPNSPLCKDYADMPARWTAPDAIGQYLPLIRDTSTTVAGMQLLPSDVKPRDRGTVWLTFDAGAFTRELLQIDGNTLYVNL